MSPLLLFAFLSVPVVALSWRTLLNFKGHGFYRFLNWECIALLVAFNYPFWVKNLLSVNQVFSWILLIISICLVVSGFIMLARYGKAIQVRGSKQDKELYRFEKTSHLVTRGIFKYIRHPLYSSLLFLTWGILLKNITPLLLIVSIFSSAFLIVAALYDEKECLGYFGDGYRQYMRNTKMFIPFII